MEVDVCVKLSGGGTNILTGMTPGTAPGTAGDDHLGRFDAPHGGRTCRTAGDPIDDDFHEKTAEDSADDDDEGPGDRWEIRRTPVVGSALGGSPDGPVESTTPVPPPLTEGTEEDLDCDRTAISDGVDRATELRSDDDDDCCDGTGCGREEEEDESPDGETTWECGRLQGNCDSVEGRGVCCSEVPGVHCVSEGVASRTDCSDETTLSKCCSDSEYPSTITDSERSDGLVARCNRRETAVETDVIGAENSKANRDAGLDFRKECTSEGQNSFNSRNMEGVHAGVLNSGINSISNSGAASNVAVGTVEPRSTDEIVGKDSDINQPLLPNFSDNSHRIDSECLSPTVNLEFSAVYWTKEKPRLEKGEEAVSHVTSASRRGLHVKFAEDEQLVTGSMEPAIPWKEAWLCSTSELVTSYKAACDHIGVKPLKKLLVQLEDVKRFDVRSDLLSLRGETLDWKHCETLEEIFKRVQFHTINMEEMRLDDDVAVTIFDLLQYYQSCVHLIMNKSTNFGTRGWQAWTKLMKQSTGLVHLEARGLTIPDHTLPVIGKYLRTGSTLQTLHLENSIRSGRHLNLLASALRTSQSVQELYLGANQLSPSDGLQLGTMLKGNTTLRLLDIRNNNLQDTGMGHICDGLAEQIAEGKGLNTLVVWNNQLTQQSMPALSRALAATKNLETLNIGHNSITNDGIHRLKDGLMQNKSLQRIGLQATKISCEGAVALAEFVVESTLLLRLDLRENSIKTGGLMALSHSLKVNKTVTCVDLDREPKKESNIKDFAEQQRRLLTDIESFVSRNSVETRTLLNSADESRVEEIDLDIHSSGRGDLAPSDEKKEAEKPEENKNLADVIRASNLSLLLGIPARCQTLESPSYSPELLGLIASAAEEDSSVTGAGSVSSPSSSSDVKSFSASSSAADSGCITTSLSSVSNVSEASRRSSDSVCLQDGVVATAENQRTVVPASSSSSVKPPIPEKPTVPDKKLVGTKRKFTIKKAVLPSIMSPKPVNTAAVLFTARPSSNSSDSSLDSDTHMCIVGSSLPESNSNSADLTKKESSPLDLHPLVKNFTTIATDKSKSDDVPTSSELIISSNAVSDVSQMSLFSNADNNETCRTVGVTETIVCAQSSLSKSAFVNNSVVQKTIVSEPSANDIVPALLESELACESSSSSESTGHSLVDILDREKSFSDARKDVSLESTVGGIAVTLEQNNLLSDLSKDNAHLSVTEHQMQLTNCPVNAPLCDTFASGPKADSCFPNVIENKELSPSEVGTKEHGKSSAEIDSNPNISSCSIINFDTAISGTDLDNTNFSLESFSFRSPENCVNVEPVGTIPDGIRLRLWSAETKDEATNVLVSVSTLENSEASDYQALGNNGLHCFDFLSLGRNGDSVSSGSESTDMVVSDCEDCSTIDDKDCENLELQIAERKVGNIVNESSEDGLFLGTSDEGDVSCSANETSLLASNNMAHADRVVDDVVHDLDSVNANASQP